MTRAGQRKARVLPTAGACALLALVMPARFSRAQTSDVRAGEPATVTLPGGARVEVYGGSGFVLLKKAAGIASGSKMPNKEKVGKVTRKQVLDIVKLKSKDMNATNEEAAFRIVSGTARSMGIEVIG